MKLSIFNKTIFFSACLLLFAVSALSGQDLHLDIGGTAKAGSYTMGAVKMVPAGTGSTGIRFENENEVLAEFDASVGSQPPTFKVGRIKFGNVSIGNHFGFGNSSFPDHLIFTYSGTPISIMTLNPEESSMHTEEFIMNHTSGGPANQGLSIENSGSNKNRWTFYSNNSFEGLSLGVNNVTVGSFTTNGLFTPSDKKLKTNIRPLPEVLPGIMALNPSTYDYIASTKNKNKSIGFIAQEVKKHFPELVLDQVLDNGKVLLQINYAGFGTIAIKAIQEQQSEINALKQEMAKLKTLLKALVKNTSED